MSKSREQLCDWLKLIDITGKKVLDIGCGPEQYWADKFVKGKPFIFSTLDVNDEFEPTFVYDMNKAPREEIAPNEHEYDIIFALETFEHLWNPIQALDNIHTWMKSGGMFYFSAPQINPTHDEWDMLRISDEWWREALERSLFSRIEIEPRVARDGLKDLLTFYKKEGMRMSKLRLRRGEQHKMSHVGYMGKARRL